MSTEVLVPPLGQTVDTLTLVSWYKHEGDAVQQGEPLYVVETDKASLDIEAPATGVLRRVTAKPGDEVKVLTAIAVIAAPGEALHFVESQVRPGRQRLFISPRARRLAEGEGVPLVELKATGPEGAIIERDVRAYLTGRAEKAEPAITPVARRMAEEAGLDWRRLAGTGPRGQVTREDVSHALSPTSPLAAPPPPAGVGAMPRACPSHGEMPRACPPHGEREGESLEIIPLSGIRAVIAERMALSHAQTAPVTLTAEADATALVELRRQLAADGVEISYNDLLLYVLAKALREHPRLNAALEGDGEAHFAVKVWRRIDIGLAVDTERGLLVPVVRDADRKGLAQLAAETKALAERARAGKCSPDELRGGTFTLTNLGMFGIDAFTPIINLPECAILGVGRIKARPVIVGDQVVGRQMVWLSLTFDHRLVDGGPAARFLQRVVQLLEKPHLLMT